MTATPTTDRPALQPSAEVLERTERGLYFIVGCGRSGTSLLQAMLSSHPRTIIPNESGFYPLIRDRHPALRDLSEPDRFEQAVDVTLQHPRIREMDLDEDQVRALAACGKRRWETILLAVLAVYAHKHGRTRTGEKSPGHVNYLDVISRNLPHARIIHMMRDPRAVTASRMRMRHTGPFVVTHLKPWLGAVRMHHRVADDLGPQRYLLVRYEDLVSDQEATLRRVCAFLDLDFDSSMLEHHRRDVKGFARWQEGHMANTLKPVFTSSIDKWRRDLSSRKVAMIEHLAGSSMREFGYEPTGARTFALGVNLALSTAGSYAYRSWRRARGFLHLPVGPSVDD